MASVIGNAVWISRLSGEGSIKCFPQNGVIGIELWGLQALACGALCRLSPSQMSCVCPDRTRGHPGGVDTVKCLVFARIELEDTLEGLTQSNVLCLPG
ncbi:hypothetical protein BaRGS_00030242 [Batillaria attramentaria]|uniref:Uncharacterized protein n=1 Tax=Batillaria attramentaria TaxID=370345 RepID=A0ABD0JVB4_9CAEN